MRQQAQWLQWLHSAFARVRSRSLSQREDAANARFRRTRANRGERSPPLAMQKVEGSSPFIRLYALQKGIFGCLFGQHMTFRTRRGRRVHPGGLEPSMEQVLSGGAARPPPQPTAC